MRASDRTCRAAARAAFRRLRQRCAARLHHSKGGITGRCEKKCAAKLLAAQVHRHFQSPDSKRHSDILRLSYHSRRAGLSNFKKPARFQPYRVRYSMS
jgi:hypothetical protein